ncbi:MAG TPA: hypothetical protein VI756_22250 [Blastocatellia bacterium]
MRLSDQAALEERVENVYNLASYRRNGQFQVSEPAHQSHLEIHDRASSAGPYEPEIAIGEQPCLNGSFDGATVSKKRLLERAVFERLLQFLDNDREIAGHKYVEVRRMLVRYFEVNRCGTAQEQADRTINIVAEKLRQGLQFKGEPFSYFFGVARYVLREWRKRALHFASVDDLSAAEHPSVEPHQATDRDRRYLEIERELDILRRCLADLPDETRQLLVAYYQRAGAEGQAERRALALRLGIPPATLRLRAFRARQKLRQKFKRRLSRGHRLTLATSATGVASFRG